MSPIFETTLAWHAAHSGAACGILTMRGVINPQRAPVLDAEKAALEAELRARFGALDRAAIRETGLLPSYAAYYKRWGQRYHVGLQIGRCRRLLLRRGQDRPGGCASTTPRGQCGGRW